MLVVVPCIMAGCTESRKNPTATRPLPVEVVQIQRVSSHQELRTYSGVLAAHRTTELAFELNGLVVNMLVDQGADVQSGQTLAELDTRILASANKELTAQRAAAAAQLAEMRAGPLAQEIESARAEVDDRNARLALVEAKRVRRENLVRQNATTSEEYEEYVLGVRSAKAQLLSAQKHLEILLQGTRRERIEMQEAVVRQLDSQIGQTELRLQQTHLVAPYAGRIAVRHIDEGQVVSAGQPILRLVQATPLEARIHVPSDAARQLVVGKSHVVRVNGHERQAQLAAISPEMNLTTRCIEVVLHLNHPQDAALFPGELVELALGRTVDEEGFWLPSTALVGDVRGLWSCFVLEAESPPTGQSTQSSEPVYRARREHVLILHAEDDRMLVRGSLPAAALVVRSGVERVAPSQLVTAKSMEQGGAL
jgi:RND family efflux transporter MFP subunit